MVPKFVATRKALSVLVAAGVIAAASVTGTAVANATGCGGCGPQLVVQVLSDCWKPEHDPYWGSRGLVWVPWGPGEIVEIDGTVYRAI